MSTAARKKDDAPISDAKIALREMSRRYGRWAGATLFDGHDGDAPRIEVYFAPREYEGTSVSTYPLTQECAQEIIKSGWVNGTPRMGYTDLHELRLSRYGEQQLAQWSKEEQDHARALLKPGVHGWSSLYQYIGTHSFKQPKSGDYISGHLFKNPMDEQFLVSVELKEVFAVPKDQK